MGLLLINFVFDFKMLKKYIFLQCCRRYFIQGVFFSFIVFCFCLYFTLLLFRILWGEKVFIICFIGKCIFFKQCYNVCKKNKKNNRVVFREVVFDYLNLEEMKDFICGNWDIRCCLFRKVGFFFFNRLLIFLYIKKIIKILENILIFYIIIF